MGFNSAFKGLIHKFDVLFARAQRLTENGTVFHYQKSV
jgi:hypothetical protein